VRAQLDPNLLEADTKLSDVSAGAQIYRNLVGGMVGELKSRRLAG
jgi:hypothetical protein